MATTSTTTIERYPSWVLGAMVGLCAALTLILLVTPAIAQAQNLDNDEDAAALASMSVQGSTNNITQTTQVVQEEEDAAGVAATMSPQQQQYYQYQQQPAYYYEPAELREVRTGDTLWSISEQRLQPNPTPEQVMNEVGRIYELNRTQIGDNPNLIFAGQQFLLPALYKEQPAAPSAPVPSGGGPPPSTPTTTPAAAAGAVVPSPSATTTEQEVVSGSAVAPKELPSTLAPTQQQQQAAAPEPNTSSNEQGLSSSDQPTTTPNEEEEEEQQTAASATEANEQPRIVPPWPAAQQQQTPSEQQPTPIPAADSIAHSFKELYESYVAERRLLGLGVIALTLGAALLMVWKLPMKRNVGDPRGWRISRGGYYYEESSPPSSSVTPSLSGGLSSGSSGSDRSSASFTEQGQTDRAPTRSEAGYLGPEENNGEQASPSPAPPARRHFRSAPPRAPRGGASRRFN